MPAYVNKLFIFLLSFLTTSPALANQSIEILVVHAYSQEYPWTKSQHLGFVEHLTTNLKLPVSISTEHLDTKRLKYTPDYAADFTDYLKKKYAAYNPDLIYVTDDNGYIFARDQLPHLFPKVPVFFSGVNNFDIAAETTTRPIRGVFERKDISKNIDLITKLDTDENDILVLGDGSNTYQAIEKEFRQQLESYPSIKASFLVHNNLGVIINAFKNRKEKFLLLTTIGEIRGANGDVLTLKAIIDGVLQATDMSIISMEDAYLFDGVLGGLVTSGNEQGKSAAQLALQYIKGGDISSIQNISQSPNIYQFDKIELTKQNIELPENIYLQARFYNIPPNLYEQHRAMIFTVLAILLIIIVLLITLQIKIRHKTKQQVRQKELMQMERIERYQSAMLQSSGASYENIDQAFRNTTRISATTLGIERVSIWLFNDSKDTIDCIDMFSTLNGHSAGLTLDRESFPVYFQALDSGRPLIINNAMENPQTAEFTDVYLKPNQILAMLDIPLYFDGEVTGVLCHEHTGSPRQWQDYEIDFASTMASRVSLSLEVSKRKKIEQGLEKEVTKRTREAVEANAAKSKFLANMSHELRTPMHAILSYANLMLKLDLDEKGNRFIQNIKTSAQRLTSLLDDLLDLSKLEAGKMELNIDENDLVIILNTHLLEVASLIQAKHIEIKMETDEKLTGHFDSRLIGQVITNLLSNAIKFSPQDSCITIRSQQEKRVLNNRLQDVFHLEFIDQGIGIPADELENIFDKFIQSSSTKNQSGGTGLGLPICKEIISLHHGDIWAQSPADDNQGTGKTGATLHVVIPVLH